MAARSRAAPLIVATARGHPRTRRGADAAHRIETRRKALSIRRWPVVEARRGRGAAGGTVRSRKAQIPGTWAEQGEHVLLDVRLLRALLVAVRLGARRGARDIDLYPR